MDTQIVVRPDKNEFLLYAMLNVLGFVGGSPDSHALRRRVMNHFYTYRGPELKQGDYSHDMSRPVAYTLIINEAPDFSQKQDISGLLQRDVEMGDRVVLPALKHFYENTDFERFYRLILPNYEGECDFLQDILDKANIREILDNAWETVNPVNMRVIPMPLEDTRCGIGPEIGGIAYQIVGPPFDYRTTTLVAHEGSHPLAKRTLEPVQEEIAKRRNLAEKITHRSYSNGSWREFFEEHFIRAMERGFIYPAVGKSDVESGLRSEEEDDGMVFIRDFYDELRKHKERPTESLSGVALRVLERLEKKYK